MSEQVSFQRARRPQQQQLRRQAILDTAQELLGELPGQHISLREIARRLGGSKSGIVRYYQTREELFLELLDRARREWLDDLERRLPASQTDPDEAIDEIATVWAQSLAERPVLCELWSMLASVLERNASAEVIRAFKLRNHDDQLRLGRQIVARLPGLDDASAAELVNTCIVITIGLWPFANPAPEVLKATEDPRLASSRIDFAESFSRSVRVLIAGLLQLGCGRR